LNEPKHFHPPKKHKHKNNTEAQPKKKPKVFQCDLAPMEFLLRKMRKELKLKSIPKRSKPE